jgi:hypothetical protein
MSDEQDTSTGSGVADRCDVAPRREPLTGSPGPQPPASPNAAVLPPMGTPSRTAPYPPRRVTEREMAYAIAQWLAGGPFMLQRAFWPADGDGSGVMLSQDGDCLLLKGNPICTRFPSEVIEGAPGTFGAAYLNARAVARIALRGDHLSLYRR